MFPLTTLKALGLQFDLLEDIVWELRGLLIDASEFSGSYG